MTGVHIPPLTHAVMPAQDGFDAIRDDWQRLVDAVPSAEWSAQPAAFDSWRAVLRPDDRLFLITARDKSGALRGVMPVSVDTAWRGPSLMPRYDYDPRDAGLIVSKSRRPIPVAQLSPPSSIPATFLWTGPLCRPEHRPEVFRSIALGFRQVPGWAVAVLPAKTDMEKDWLSALSDAGLSAHRHDLGRMVLNIDKLAPFDDILARQKWKFRQNVRRARKRAETDKLRFDIFAGRAEVLPRLQTVAYVAGKSWKATGRSTVDVHLPYAGEQRAYFEHLLARDDTSAIPVLGVVSDADGPVAVLLMLRHGSGLTALLTFWDGRHAKASPGLLLMGTAIDWATEQGLSRLDLNATASWVRHISDSTTELCNIAVFNQSFQGRAYAAFARAIRRVRS